jgi:hypothetical protein
VNTTYSAVRITHIPSGEVVACQDERSQLKNREKALKILKSRLLEKEREKQEAEEAAERKQQVGTGDRSEKIRTYNFPQSRVTDHRAGVSLYKIDAVMDGDIDEFINALTAADNAERLKNLGPRLSLPQISADNIGFKRTYCCILYLRSSRTSASPKTSAEDSSYNRQRQIVASGIANAARRRAFFMFAETAPGFTMLTMDLMPERQAVPELILRRSRRSPPVYHRRQESGVESEHLMLIPGRNGTGGRIGSHRSESIRHPVIIDLCTVQDALQ